MRTPLKGAYATVTLDINGNGIASVGPISARETWYPANVHVSVNPGNVTNEAQCLVYVGPAVEANYFRDGTLSGSSGDSTDALSADMVVVGEKIFAQWIGGDSGFVATLVITGEKDV